MNMIAIGTGEAWILIGMVGLTLWIFWAMLNWTFTLIDRAHERMRREAVSANRERGN